MDVRKEKERRDIKERERREIIENNEEIQEREERLNRGCGKIRNENERRETERNYGKRREEREEIMRRERG